MTTPHPNLEQLSAFVDGLDEDGTDDHVRHCTVCAAAVEELRKAAAAVSAWPTKGAAYEAQADRAVTAALDAVAPGEVGTSPVIMPLRRRHRLPAWVLPAAAAVLIVAAAVPLAARLSSTSSTKHGTATALSTPRAANDQAAGVSAAATSAGGTTTDLGVVDDPEHLRSALVSVSAGAFATSSAPGAATAGNAASTAADAPAQGAPASPTKGATTVACVPAQPVGAGPVQYSALLLWRGTPARVEVRVGTDGRRLAVVTSRADCSVLFTLPL